MNGDDPIRFDQENRGLIIPVKEDDFRQFITSLLGRPQTITKRIDIRFEVRREDIENCFHLVDQRISQQNDATLVQFIVTIEYDDGSSILLNSLYDFISYKEIRDIASVGAELSWTYLIRFNKSNVPEKQTVELSLSTPRRKGHESFNPLVSPVVSALRRQSGNVGIRIQHTARSWGADIENLLSDQIKKWDIPRPKLECFVIRRSVSLSFLAALSFALLAWYWLYRTTISPSEDFAAAVSRAKEYPIEQKLDFLLEALRYNPVSIVSNKVAIGCVAVFIASMFLWVRLIDMADIRADSHLLLSDKSQKILDKENRKRQWSLKYFIGTAISSTLAGIVSKYVISFII